MNEVGYLKTNINDNVNAVMGYINKGYLDISVFDVNREDKIKTICDIYPNILLNDLDIILNNFENAYVASLRVIGDKSALLFEQLDDIRSGKIWKRL